ncbi:MAG: efflux RND transporter periplasmic adaptor subunit, partial [Burkholderiales bacterium]|nr:efflux RND transporter periplasmic adaptor subunit [Burkholderiales bacterium]
MLKKSNIALLAGCALALAFGARMLRAQPSAETSAPAKQDKPDEVTVTDKQLKYVTVAAVAQRAFTPQSESVGYIDFNQDKNVQVFSPWTGRIAAVMVKAGDDVKRGQALFTIDSPDLLNAESTLISTAGVEKLTHSALERARGMRETQAMAEKDFEQAVSDNQTAEANYHAARDAVRIFGKSDTEMDAIVASHKTNGVLAITSPINGRVTARNAADGLLVQPGNAPAPFSVADISSLWMVANVSESDLPQLALGQKVSVKVAAYPGKTFAGVLSNVGAAIDPSTHRVAVHADLADPGHL